MHEFLAHKFFDVVGRIFFTATGDGNAVKVDMVFVGVINVSVVSLDEVTATAARSASFLGMKSLMASFTATFTAEIVFS